MERVTKRLCLCSSNPSLLSSSSNNAKNKQKYLHLRCCTGRHSTRWSMAGLPMSWFLSAASTKFCHESDRIPKSWSANWGEACTLIGPSGWKLSPKWITSASKWSRWHFSCSKSVWFPSVRLEPRSYVSHCGTSSSSAIEATMFKFLFRVEFEFMCALLSLAFTPSCVGGEWDPITQTAVGWQLEGKIIEFLMPRERRSQAEMLADYERVWCVVGGF